MSEQFVTTRFVLVPLTPVHVGGGDEAQLRPEGYRFTDGALELFSPWAALAELPEGQRNRVAADLVRAPIEGLKALRRSVPEAAVLDRIGLSAVSRRELERALDIARHGQQRSGTVSAFQRDGSRPLIPGSTLKGALRTAWLARWAEGLPPPSGRGSERSRELVSRAFGLASGKHETDTDPLRDVTVRDVTLPPGATRIDPVRSWKRARDRDGRPLEGYDFGSVGQMHWERLLSVIDGFAPPLAEAEIGLRAPWVRSGRAGRPNVAPRADRVPGEIAALLAALNVHHIPLWRREVEEKFFAGDLGARLNNALALFSGMTLDGEDPDAAMIRIGRGGHAESKSVASFREVHRPQAKTREGKVASEGSTRHVVDLGGQPAPFGWMLLVRVDRWRAPASWLPEPGRVEAPPGGRAAPAAGRSAQGQGAPHFLYRAGDRITVSGEPATVLENVPINATELNVDFGDGPEPIKASEIDE